MRAENWVDPKLIEFKLSVLVSDLVSISSTFYARLLCTKVLRAAYL